MLVHSTIVKCTPFPRPGLPESSRRSFPTNTSSSSLNDVSSPNPSETLLPPTSNSDLVPEPSLLSTRRSSTRWYGLPRSSERGQGLPRTVESSSECMSILGQFYKCSRSSFSFLDPKDQNLLEYKLDTFSSVYRNLAGKDVHFE
jgi:hypothetical protein